MPWSLPILWDRALEGAGPVHINTAQEETMGEMFAWTLERWGATRLLALLNVASLTSPPHLSVSGLINYNG